MNNATAVGIADGGGTVGNLTISNVGVGVGSNLGSAVDIDQGGTLNVTLESLSSSGSAGQGVQLAANGAALTGTFSATAGSISGSTGTAFQVGTGDAGAAGTGGVAAISYGGVIASTGAVRAVEIEDRAASAGAINLSGNITQTTGTASGIVLDDNVAGNITFSGAANTLASTTATGLSITDQTGGTVTFSSALAVTTTSGTGVNLANNTGGTINSPAAATGSTSPPPRAPASTPPAAA